MTQPTAHPLDATDSAPTAWQPGYSALGPRFVTHLRPTPLPDPHWIAHSDAVASLAGLDPQWLQSDQALQALTGNSVLPGSAPVATVYSGHQFGVWAGQLGDGRAILLGETASGYEIQLKGAGRTPYSRMGDGRAVLRSSIREFLCSEAMHALGIPTTRALSLTGSPAPIYREEIETAAVVARVAPSFIRFGHFEHFSAKGDEDALRTLADYVIDRYYPECRTQPTVANNPYASLLQAVSERTAALIAQWQSVGFCHGVMNTDNMSILGLTVDYGPFQFLDGFDPGHICNHSDNQGRYAFDAQPNVGYWNVTCLAQTLLPLIGEVETARTAIGTYPATFAQHFLERMGAKLGIAPAQLPEHHAKVEALINRLSPLLASERVDYSIFWRRLSQCVAANHYDAVRDVFIDREAWQVWLLSYQELLAHVDQALAADLMLKTNPEYVLRNHLCEQAIRAAKQGEFSEVRRLQTILAKPFETQTGQATYADFPPDWAAQLEISCSS